MIASCVSIAALEALLQELCSDQVHAVDCLEPGVQMESVPVAAVSVGIGGRVEQWRGPGFE